MALITVPLTRSLLQVPPSSPSNQAPLIKPCPIQVAKGKIIWWFKLHIETRFKKLASSNKLQEVSTHIPAPLLRHH